MRTELPTKVCNKEEKVPLKNQAFSHHKSKEAKRSFEGCCCLHKLSVSDCFSTNLGKKKKNKLN